MIAGPFLGEWGWALLRWQGHLRWLAESKEVIVRCLNGHSYIYKDFASEVHDTYYHHEEMSPNMWMPTEESYHLMPSKKLCCDPNLKQRFIKYGKKNYSGKFDYDVIIHARNCKRTGDKITGDRTYPPEMWEGLVEKLGVSACVGSPEEADYIDGVEHDLRGIPLETLANVLANTKLIIGPSSGVMHFASLCGCPHLVWSDKRKWNLGGRKGTNWTRYMHYWNPFMTACFVIDDEPDPWKPSVGRIMRAIEKNRLL